MVFLLAGLFACAAAVLLVLDAQQKRSHDQKPTVLLEPESIPAINTTTYQAAQNAEVDDEVVEDNADLEELWQSHAAIIITPFGAGHAPFEADNERLFPALPGYRTRLKRAWAQHYGFSFSSTDDYLADEWTRGPATISSTVRHSISGMAAGYEMHIGLIGESMVMAMHLNASSPVVVEMHRDDFHTHGDELIAVSQCANFFVTTTHPGPVQRMLDERVYSALINMPDAVAGLWIESEWVCAWCDLESQPDLWEKIVVPLALLADATATLPPHHDNTLDFASHPPTRPLVSRADHTTYAPKTPPRLVLPAQIAEELGREDIELDLPTRVYERQWGTLDIHTPGEDNVDSIADNPSSPPQPSDFLGTRALRPHTEKSTIFSDWDR
ncbi:hypothetical protein [Corynebacterium sp. ES2715-CONJ3]|uniref:hypothetical protein n=1 Tax=Corynebacterium sp. ES2715-CONJ3 TaxID=2974028 RepID=UPI0021687F80|nr:hypothetical protein [Corynebacterium sp. ES2715-CONJ3]MCS4492000.1 hypothetical protein [Corynebacterium sp. ES2715-CONJ3]